MDEKVYGGPEVTELRHPSKIEDQTVWSTVGKIELEVFGAG